MATLRDTRIRHTVAFTLRHEESSPEAGAFFSALSSLAAIDGVEELEITMEFASDAAYRAHNDHPLHAAFVRDRWDVDVADFLEIDLAALHPGASGDD